jgi:hypothetical protein
MMIFHSVLPSLKEKYRRPKLQRKERNFHFMENFLLFQVNRNTRPEQEAIHLFVNNSGVQTLGVLDVDGLDVGVESLLGALLVVTLAGDADTEAEGNTLDTGFPDLLVQLGVEADILGALITNVSG